MKTHKSIDIPYFSRNSLLFAVDRIPESRTATSSAFRQRIDRAGLGFKAVARGADWMPQLADDGGARKASNRFLTAA